MIKGFSGLEEEIRDLQRLYEIKCEQIKVIVSMGYLPEHEIFRTSPKYKKLSLEELTILGKP